jgi:VIT1/CCC1 family predicted Fe2+/Mn2+ transporter
MRRFVTRYLDPSEWMSELLFGLVMTLTFTLGASLVIEEGPDATRELLVGVIGCNLAWGVIDGLLYIFNSMFARGAMNRAAHLLKREGREAADARLTEYVHENFGDALSAPTQEALQRELLDGLAQIQPARVRMTRDDLYGAIASFLLVLLTAAPAVVPFLLIKDHLVALRVSNLLMIGLLYLIGYRWASHIDANRQRVGLSMALGGLVIVQMTIMLGG